MHNKFIELVYILRNFKTPKNVELIWQNSFEVNFLCAFYDQHKKNWKIIILELNTIENYIKEVIYLDFFNLPFTFSKNIVNELS